MGDLVRSQASPGSAGGAADPAAGGVGREYRGKRALDLMLGLFALVVAAPAILVAMAALRIAGRPAFERRRLIGRNGSVIGVLRLRLPTPVDRLPELWSVVRGDLSLVGPPARDAADVTSTGPGSGTPLGIRPGITGLSQLQAVERPADGPAEGTIASGARLSLDTYYVQHQSPWLDLRIIGRTALVACRWAASLATRALPRAGSVWARRLRSRAGRRVHALAVRTEGRHLLALDVAGLIAAVYLALAFRFDALGELEPLARYAPAALLPVLVRPPVYAAFGLYQRLWRAASIPELARLIVATLAGSVVSIVLFYLVLVPLRVPGTSAFPTSFWLLEALLSLAVVSAPRLAIRGLGVGPVRPAVPAVRRRPALLYGAGEAGAMVARSAAREPSAGVVPAGFLDDDPATRGKRVAGLPVFGAADALPDAVTLTGAELLLITMPSAAGPTVRRVTEVGMAAGLEVRTVPPVHELLDGSVDAFRVRRVRVEDLIRRPTLSQQGSAVEGIVRDRVVLVTGAGGSIGSELARQVLGMRPRRLILLERGESAAYAVERELEARLGSGPNRVEIEVSLANVASRATVERLIARWTPDVILHAAACKHVPLMEVHPSEAVQVNVGGTRAVLDAALAAGTPRFVLVSTDKAVLPASTMGATKRIAEWLVADAARRVGRAYVSVRFGNVLGSNGSVVPIFQSQLESGQPLTVTHPDMTRYFMTIPEASALILEAAALGQAGDVFVLDMGSPVRILDLAHDFVRLAGRDPDTVPIAFTGLRPGEKLHEQLFYEHETARPTANPKVLLAAGDEPPERIRSVAADLLALADGAHDVLLRQRLFSAIRSGNRLPSRRPVRPDEAAAPLVAAVDRPIGVPRWHTWTHQS